MQTAEFNLPGMTCESCATKIESAVRHAGANDINFDFKTRNVTITFDEQKTSQEQLKSVIRNTGYDVV